MTQAMGCYVRPAILLTTFASTCVALQAPCTDVDCSVNVYSHPKRDSKVVAARQVDALEQLHTVDQKSVDQKYNGASLAGSFEGLHVALAWHGIYQRHMIKHRGGGRNLQTCSDYFHAAANIHRFITEPLTNAGARVSNYVHTYHRSDCPRKDQRLLDALQPKNSSFWDISNHRIVDSYIEVLKMVLNDKDTIDFIVLLRFDVGYTKSILEWNMTLDTVGIPYLDNPFMWDKCSMVSDLVFTFPMSYTTAMIHALDWSGSGETEDLHFARGGAHKGEKQHCAHAFMHGPGHFLYQPLAAEIGEENVRVMDYQHHTSRIEVDKTPSFLGIDRFCADDYFEGCPNSTEEWVDNGLWLVGEEP